MFLCSVWWLVFGDCQGKVRMGWRAWDACVWVVRGGWIACMHMYMFYVYKRIVLGSECEVLIDVEQRH